MFEVMHKVEVCVSAVNVNELHSVCNMPLHTFFIPIKTKHCLKLNLKHWLKLKHYVPGTYKFKDNYNGAGLHDTKMSARRGRGLQN